VGTASPSAVSAVAGAETPSSRAQPRPRPTDPLTFREWPSGLWWAQTDERGHVVVLTSWGTSCRACVEALPQLQRIATRFESRGVHAYAVNVEPDATRFPTLLNGLPAHPVVLMDPGGERLAVVLGMSSIPTTWVLTPNGKVAWVQEGWDATIAATLSEKLAELVGGGT
jgi:thiol-disulfide isomerase/thioredoxin